MHPLFQDALNNYTYNVPELPRGAPRPTNIVVTVYLEYGQSLELLPKHYANTKVNNSHFMSCNTKLNNPTATILLFGAERGKLVCVGAMVPNIGFYALMKVRLQLLSLGAKALFNDPNISNVVMTGNYHMHIDMARFVAANDENCNYAPGVFSGCSYSPYGLDKVVESGSRKKKKGKKKKMVLFERGKYNLMGLSSYEEAYKMAADAYEAIKPFECEERQLADGQKIVLLRERELAEERTVLNNAELKRAMEDVETPDSKRQKGQTPVY